MSTYSNTQFLIWYLSENMAQKNQDGSSISPQDSHFFGTNRFSNQASTTEPCHRHSQLLAIATTASETARPGGFHHGLTGK